MGTAATEPQLDSSVLCSKCKLKPRADAESTNPWCNDCKTKYQKEYKELIARRSSERAFIAGVEAMRQTLALEFSRLGKIAFSGREVAFAVVHTPRPQMTIEAEKA